MKKEFFDLLFDLMKENEDIFFLYGDLGYPRVEGFKKAYPKRVFNCGASEQTMMDIAVGLSYQGKIPVTYTIAPFYYRAWETLRTYIDHEKLKVIMVGAGVNDDYGKHDGFSHDSTDLPLFMKLLKNIIFKIPKNEIELEFIMNYIIYMDNPMLINIKR